MVREVWPVRMDPIAMILRSNIGREQRAGYPALTVEACLIGQ